MWTKEQIEKYRRRAGYPECVPGFIERKYKIDQAFLSIMENPDSTKEEKDAACDRYDSQRMAAIDMAYGKGKEER